MKWQLALLEIQHKRSMKSFFNARNRLTKAIERAHLFLSMNKKRIEKLHEEEYKLSNTNKAIEQGIAAMTKSVNHINQFIGE